MKRYQLKSDHEVTCRMEEKPMPSGCQPWVRVAVEGYNPCNVAIPEWLFIKVFEPVPEESGGPVYVATMEQLRKKLGESERVRRTLESTLQNIYDCYIKHQEKCRPSEDDMMSKP